MDELNWPDNDCIKYMESLQKFILFSLSDNSDKHTIQKKVDEMIDQGWEVETITMNNPDQNYYRCWVAITFRPVGYKNLPGIK